MTLLPGSTGNNSLHRRMVDAEATSHRADGLAVLTEVPSRDDLVQRQAAAPVPFSCGLAALGVTVGIVDGPRALEEMVLPNTRRIVAGMQHVYSCWRPPVDLGPGESVGKDHRAAEPEGAVAVFVAAGRPDPASIGLENLRPKAIHGPEGMAARGESQ